MRQARLFDKLTQAGITVYKYSTDWPEGVRVCLPNGLSQKIFIERRREKYNGHSVHLNVQTSKKFEPRNNTQSTFLFIKLWVTFAKFVFSIKSRFFFIRHDLFCIRKFSSPQIGNHSLLWVGKERSGVFFHWSTFFSSNSIQITCAMMIIIIIRKEKNELS